MAFKLASDDDSTMRRFSMQFSSMMYLKQTLRNR